MSEENVEIVRRDVAARDARDWSNLAEIWHPEIEWTVLRGGGTYRGLDELTDFFETLSNLLADYRVEAAELLKAEDLVITVERISGRGLKGDGVGAAQSRKQTRPTHTLAHRAKKSELSCWGPSGPSLGDAANAGNDRHVIDPIRRSARSGRRIRPNALGILHGVLRGDILTPRSSGDEGPP